MSGREFLRAAVAGYEVGPRVGQCMGQEHIVQGWHSGATVGVFSAAAGAAAGLRLPADKVVHALGIAGTQSAGLMAAQFGAMVKAHARRPLGAERARTRGAARRERVHRDRECVRERVWRVLTTFSRSQDRIQSERAYVGLGRAVRDDAGGAEVLFVRGHNHTSLDAIRLMQAAAAVRP